MGILSKMAWRNVWRNPRRSMLLIGVIGLGVFSFLGSISFMDGFAEGMLNAAVDLQGGHIQVMKEGYFKNPNIRTFIADGDDVADKINSVDNVVLAPMVSIMGMANSSDQAGGVNIRGVDPARESEVSRLWETMVEGAYAFDDGNQVLIGRSLAEHLDVRLGEKIVLMASDLQNELSSGAFRVSGIFDSGNSTFDKMNVYVSLDDARNIAGYTETAVTLFSIRILNDAEMDPIVTALDNKLADQSLSILSWRDRMPMVVMALDAYDYVSVLLVIIMFTAIAFTIVNSFLMVIFERIREIGIMMANGVRPAQIRRLLYLEAIILVIIGLIVGTLVAILIMAYYHTYGIDLSSFSDTMDVMGLSTILYPSINWFHILTGFIAIFFMVLLAVFYPAMRASRFETVEAINYV